MPLGSRQHPHLNAVCTSTQQGGAGFLCGGARGHHVVHQCDTSALQELAFARVDHEGALKVLLSIVASQFGLVGGCLLLTLYFFIIARSLYMAAYAPDTYGRLLSGSLTLIFFIYAFVNSGMVSGLLPVVGLPLPLFSYGGTSLVTIMAGFGILMSIYSHRRPRSR